MAMTTLLSSAAVHPHCGLIAKGGPRFKCGNNFRVWDVDLRFSRPELRSSPLHLGRRQMTRAMASEGAASTTSRTREELKKLVMRAVTNTDRGKAATDEQKQYIFALLTELEGQNPTVDPIDSPALCGRWALLYTAPIDEETSDKYAGTEEGPFLSRVKPVTLGSVRQSRSFQVLDTDRGAAENIAEFTFLGREGSLTIYGSVTKSAATEKGAVRVDVTFDSFVLRIGSITFPSVSLSWISPKGWIETTYLDENFRIGRGDKGSIFVAARAKQI